MHIPDGYLSPSTCAAMYAGAGPFWYVALNRVRRLLHTRFIPLLSLFAAFSFVLMMFNIPLPGGTTGHALGIGIAAVVLGPWGAILSLSVALMIQAIFFGDGGITAIGANCFNMAVVGSLIASGVYRLVAGRSALDSRRRVIAAGLAGYAAINAAAFCAAVEFGIQPILFHDASGSPLYAPYPLHISLPAMMLGHLAIAGFAEMFVAAGLVVYIQRTDLSLLRLTAAPNAPAESGSSLKALWATLAFLMVLTPLGILAVGTAWGEWGASSFADSNARREIAAVSLNQAPPDKAPAGLQRLSKVWTAPFPAYAPPLLKSAMFGYFMSCLLGVGLVILSFSLLGWLTNRLQV
jgi:cobalt/nickel transport system permease protein